MKKVQSKISKIIKIVEVDVEKKYELTDKIRYRGGVMFHRIRALKNFSDVKKGDFGGWVEKESNLSQKGTCWVYDDACVRGNGLVCGDGRVCDYGLVRDNGIVCDHGLVCDHGIVRDNALVRDNGIVCDHGIVRGNGLVRGFRVYGRDQGVKTIAS